MIFLEFNRIEFLYRETIGWRFGVACVRASAVAFACSSPEFCPLISSAVCVCIYGTLPIIELRRTPKTPKRTYHIGPYQSNHLMTTDLLIRTTLTMKHRDTHNIHKWMNESVNESICSFYKNMSSTKKMSNRLILNLTHSYSFWAVIIDIALKFHTHSQHIRLNVWYTCDWNDICNSITRTHKNSSSSSSGKHQANSIRSRLHQNTATLHISLLYTFRYVPLPSSLQRCKYITRTFLQRCV